MSRTRRMEKEKEDEEEEGEEEDEEEGEEKEEETEEEKEEKEEEGKTETQEVIPKKGAGKQEEVATPAPRARLARRRRRPPSWRGACVGLVNLEVLWPQPAPCCPPAASTGFPKIPYPPSSPVR
eukprot:349991-Pyramimonas_sp.AAC.2